MSVLTKLKVKKQVSISLRHTIYNIMMSVRPSVPKDLGNH